MTAKVHRADNLPDAPQSRALRGRRGRQAPLKSSALTENALTEGITWLFEALRATSYFVLPPYEQILIYRAASLPNTFYRRASAGNSDGQEIATE